MAESTNIPQVLFTSLQLLGLDPVANEKSLRIPFQKDMFNLPNKKGFECVMHFLFNKLDPIKCKEEFKTCWPVGDKKDEAMFRKVCNNWLSDIAKNDPDAHLPRIVASLFMSPGGEKFIRFLFAFANYVVLKTCTHQFGVNQREFLRHPVVTAQSQPLGCVVAEALMCGMARHRKAFVQHAHDLSQLHDLWRAEAKELVNTYRSLTKNIRELERQVQSEIQHAVAMAASPVARRRKSGSLDYNNEVNSVKRASKVQKLRENWKNVASFCESQAKPEEIVSSVLEGSEERHCIDANCVSVKVPDVLLQQCESEIHRRNVSNVYQGGKLNILSLVHLWNLSLHLYIEKLHQEGVPSFDHLQEVISSHKNTSKAHVSSTERLRAELETDLLPNLQSSIKDLQHKLDASVLQGQSPNSLRSTNSLGLGLMPPTPPLAFGPLNTPQDKQFLLSSKLSLASEKHHVPTPEAALQMLQEVRSKVSAAIPLVMQGHPVYAPCSSPDRRKPSQLSQKRYNQKATGGHVTAFKNSHLTEHQPLTKPGSTVRRTSNRRRYPKNEPKSSSSSEAKTPPEQRDKADRIVAAMLEDSSPGPLFSPPSSVHSYAPSDLREGFQHRDKLGRSPVEASHRWHRKLKDQGECPLSSTRNEQSEEEAKPVVKGDDPSVLDTSSSVSPPLPTQLNSSSTWLAQESRESSPASLPPALSSSPSSIHSSEDNVVAQQSLARVLDFEDIGSQTSVDNSYDDHAQGDFARRTIYDHMMQLSGELDDLIDDTTLQLAPADSQEEFKNFASFTQTPEILKQRMQESIEDEGHGGQIVEYENGSFSERPVELAAAVEDSLLKTSHIEAGLRLTQNLETELENWRQKGLVPSSHGDKPQKSIDDIRTRFNRLKVQSQQPKTAEPLVRATPRKVSFTSSPDITSAKAQYPDIHFSPLANLLHSDHVEDSQKQAPQHRISLGPGILDLDEDDSFLVPSSPIEVSHDVPVADLLEL